MTIIYEVRARADIFSGSENFDLKVIKHEGLETSKSFKFNQKRIDKDSMNKIRNHNDSSRAIGLHAYTTEDNLVETKQMVVEELRKLALLRLEELTKLVAVTKKTPIEKFRDETI